jgi:hypothetical protein
MTSFANVAIQSSQVTADLTDFPLLVDLSDMTAGFWSTVLNGGGDIRVFKADGTTELSREVVSCDTTAQTGELWVKYTGTLSSSINTTIQIHADGVSSDYAVTATYGRNNVWSAYSFVFHGENLFDSAGNGYDLTAVGAATSGDSGKVGSAFTVGNNTGFETRSGTNSFSTTDAVTTQAWVKRTLDNGSNDTNFQEVAVIWENAESLDGLSWGVGSIDYLHAVPFAFTDGGNTQGTIGAAKIPVDSTWYMEHVEFDQPNNVIRLTNNGGAVTAATGYTDNSSGGSVVLLGLKRSLDAGIVGQFDEVRGKLGVLGDSWIATEYNNQSSPGTFYTVSFGSNVSKVSGIVQIDGTPAERTVRAFGYSATEHDIDGETVNLSKSLGHSTSDPATGEYTIDLLAGYGSEIFVVAFDDYGDAFTAEQALAVGDRVHPTTPNGHVWETTGAGTLPIDEPTWVVDTETSQLYGTASMIARPFYRPMVHGPITPEVVEAP